MPIDMINVIGNHVLIFMIIKLPKPKRLDSCIFASGILNAGPRLPGLCALQNAALLVCLPPARRRTSTPFFIMPMWRSPASPPRIRVASDSAWPLTALGLSKHAAAAAPRPLLAACMPACSTAAPPDRHAVSHVLPCLAQKKSEKSQKKSEKFCWA